MSVERIMGVAACSSAKGSKLAILFILANHENQETYACFPSIDTIAAEANLSRRQVQNNLRALEDDDELIIVTGGIRAGRALANQYELTVPRLTGEEFARTLQARAEPESHRVQSATEDRVQSATDRVQPSTDQGEAHDTPPVQSATDERYETAPQPEEEPEEEPEKEPQSYLDPVYRKYSEKCRDWSDPDKPENISEAEEAFFSLLEEGHTVGDLIVAYKGATAGGITDLTEILVADKIEDYKKADPMSRDWREAAAA